MSPVRMSRLESAMRVALDFHEAFNRADIAALQALIAEDCLLETSHPAPGGMTYQGRVAITDFWQDLFNESAQIHLEIEDIFGSGSHCVVRWNSHWDDSGPGARSLRGVGLFLVRENLISEIYAYTKG